MTGTPAGAENPAPRMYTLRSRTPVIFKSSVRSYPTRMHFTFLRQAPEYSPGGYGWRNRLVDFQQFAKNRIGVELQVKDLFSGPCSVNVHRATIVDGTTQGGDALIQMLDTILRGPHPCVWNFSCLHYEP